LRERGFPSGFGNNVYVGYSSGTAKDGSDGKSSTIAEFTSNRVLLGTASVLGHNDGLRYDVATNQIWSLQNEDANTNLVLITPGTLSTSQLNLSTLRMVKLATQAPRARG
jgi:hypothetical protein